MCTSTKKISLVEILSQTPRQTMPVFFTSYITANTALYAFRFWAWFSGRCYHTLTSISNFKDQIRYSRKFLSFLCISPAENTTFNKMPIRSTIYFEWGFFAFKSKDVWKGSFDVKHVKDWHWFWLVISWGASTAYLTVQHDWFIHTSKFFATFLNLCPSFVQYKVNHCKADQV